MNNDVINIIAVVSLSLLGVSLLVLVISLIPLINQGVRTLVTVDEIAKLVKEKIIPNLADISEVLGKTNNLVKQGETLTNKVSQSAGALIQGIKAGLGSYLDRNSKSR